MARYGPVNAVKIDSEKTADVSYMNIQLVSKDSELCRLCREVLAELPGRSALSVVDLEDVRTGADAYIWDFEPNLPIPEVMDQNRSRRLFLVHRKDLAALQDETVAEGNILLKPVTRATLAAFLEMAILRRAGSSPLTDRDETVHGLIQANLRLQEYDHDRTNFLARAVHDFRAPLTALSGYCGLLLDGPLGSLDANQREVLQRMQNSVQPLSRMASAMSLLSAGLQVKKRPDLQKGDISERLNQSLHEVAPVADEKKISITPDLEPCDDLYFE